MTSNKDKALLVTGAAGGLGSALAGIAALNQWQVVMVDKDKRGLERCYDRLVDKGAREPYLHVTDLASIGPDECDQLVTVLQEQVGGLNALVHCAVSFPGLQPLDLIEPNDWLQQMQVNVNAPWLLSNKLIPLLKQSENASLVFLMDEQVENRPLWGAYGTSKAALRSLAAQFRAELNNSSISVHAIDPGAMRTSLRSSVFHSENPLEVTLPDVRAKQIFEILNHDSSVKGDLFIQLS